VFGYELISYRNQNFKIAEPEKAILDYFYLNTNLRTTEDFDGLRFNSEEFKEQTNKDILRNYLAAFSNKRLEKRFNKFLKYINYD